MLRRSPLTAHTALHARTIDTVARCCCTRSLVLVRCVQAFIFDGRNILDHSALQAIGFEVHAIGKGKLSKGSAAAAK